MSNLLLFSFAEWKPLLMVILIGAVAGALCDLILRGRGFGMVFSVILGIAGSWLGNKFILKYVSFSANSLVNEIIAATAGALVITLLINIVFGKNKGRDRTAWRA